MCESVSLCVGCVSVPVSVPVSVLVGGLEHASVCVRVRMLVHMGVWVCHVNVSTNKINLVCGMLFSVADANKYLQDVLSGFKHLSIEKLS